MALSQSKPTKLVKHVSLNRDQPRPWTSGMSTEPSTLYMPISSPPTPAPSPGPSYSSFSLLRQDGHHANVNPYHFTSPSNSNVLSQDFTTLAPPARRQFLAALLARCTPSELLFVSTTIAPLLKRDFIRELPPEIALHILSFVQEPKCLARMSQVSRCWRKLLMDESIWKRMCWTWEFWPGKPEPIYGGTSDEEESDESDDEDEDPEHSTPRVSRRRSIRDLNPNFSYREFFKLEYTTMTNWRRGGHLLRAHRVPIVTPDSGVITSVAIDNEWVVVGLANCRIHVFSAKTGVLSRTLVGHELGVWAVNLVSRGGHWGGDEDEVEPRAGGEDGGEEHLVPPGLRAGLGLDGQTRRARRKMRSKPSDVCSASEGWGQANALIVSGGCDKVVRVWDVKSGYCIYVLHGHTSTIRCIKVLHNRPIAVSGSRDSTVRVWDVQRGRMIRVLHGHQQSVRCLDVFGNKVVSGSYDCTCRLWDVDTGECLHVLRGHFHQIYSVAYDGERIASGGLDTTVRVWDASTGQCTALLQGHTALVCQLQLSHDILATGGSDGRVITFTLASPSAPATSSSSFQIQHRIAAHDSSVTSLQFDRRILVTGGNDGRVKLFETKSGRFVRELCDPSESVWKVAYRGNVCVVMCKRSGKTVTEIWSFRPDAEGE